MFYILQPFFTIQHTVGLSIIRSIMEDDKVPPINNLAWLWHNFPQALDGDQTHDLPIVSRVR